MGSTTRLYYILYRNECGGFYVRRAAVCRWLFTLGTLLFRCGAVLRGFLSARSALSYWFGAERILRGRVVSPAALRFL